LLSLDKIIYNKSTINDNDNENISKIEFNLNSYRNMKNKKTNYFIEKYNSIITDKNDFNNLIYRNKSYRLKTIDKSLNNHKNAFNISNYKNDKQNKEKEIKTDINNISRIKKHSSLKIFTKINDEELNNKYINDKYLQKLFMKNRLYRNEKSTIDLKEERAISSYENGRYSYRNNSFNNYINIRNKLFNENSSYMNNISINNISKIHKVYKNKSEFHQKSSKPSKYLGKYMLPKPPNSISSKKKILKNNSIYNLTPEILNFNNINKYDHQDMNNNLYINKGGEKFDIFDLNIKKEKYKDIIENRYGKYYNNFQNKIYNNNNNKISNLHKLFYDELKNTNNVTEREYINEHPQLMGDDKNKYYSKCHKSITRNNSEISNNFTDYNIQKYFNKKLF
jgi:hypothetical protein